MVVTEREIRRCRRCGEEKVLSESTEVRAIRTEDDVGIDRRDDDAVAPASSTQGPTAADGVDATPETTALDGTTESVDATERVTPDEGRSEPTEPEAEPSNTSLIERAEAGFDDAAPSDPAEEDAVILDESDDTSPRSYGEWPDSGDGGGSPAGPTPEPADEHLEGTAGEAADAVDDSAATDADTSLDASPADEDDSDDPNRERSVAETAAEEDAELLDSGTDGDDGTDGAATVNGHDATDAGGAWPAHGGEDEGFAAASATAGGPEIAYGNTIAPQSAAATAQSANGHSHDDGYETSYLDKTVEERDGDGTIVSAGADDVSGRAPGVETEYYCPNCGHARPLDSSLRSGDICPECQQGYIAERAR